MAPRDDDIFILNLFLPLLFLSYPILVDTAAADDGDISVHLNFIIFNIYFFLQLFSLALPGHFNPGYLPPSLFPPLLNCVSFTGFHVVTVY